MSSSLTSKYTCYKIKYLRVIFLNGLCTVLLPGVPPLTAIQPARKREEKCFLKAHKKSLRGTWVAQRVGHRTVDFGSHHDLTVSAFESHVGL